MGGVSLAGITRRLLFLMGGPLVPLERVPLRLVLLSRHACRLRPLVCPTPAVHRRSRRQAGSLHKRRRHPWRLPGWRRLRAPARKDPPLGHGCVRSNRVVLEGGEGVLPDVPTPPRPWAPGQPAADSEQGSMTPAQGGGCVPTAVHA